jgi:hypothetical protein
LNQKKRTNKVDADENDEQEDAVEMMRKNIEEAE